MTFFALFAVEADRLDIIAKPVPRERQHLFRRIGDSEELPVALLTRIRRLRRESDRHDERERIDVLELAFGSDAAPKIGGRFLDFRPAVGTARARAARCRFRRLSALSVAI